MKQIVPRAFVTRRDFLQRLAASGASSLAAPRLPMFLALGSTTSFSRRIGLLMPAFAAYPQVGASFRDGLNLFLGQQRVLQQLQIVATDAGSQTGISEEALEQLCRDTRLDAVVSMANPSLSSNVRAVLARVAVPLLISHAGANRVDTVEANVFYNTLGYWQASYRAGAWAAEGLGRRAVVVSSFYESGYDALHAFEQGLTDHGGGVARRYVTHTPGRPLAMDELMRGIATAGPDFVYGHFSGPAAADFVTAYSSSSRTRHTPLLGSTFLLGDAVPGPAAGAVRDVHSVSSWSPLLQTVENEQFCRVFAARYGRAADSFAVLGYETAGLLAAASEIASKTGTSFAAALSQAHFEGPRGQLTMGAATQSIAPPLYLRQVSWQEGRYQARVRASLTPVSEQTVRSDGPRSGWINPYFSI